MGILEVVIMEPKAQNDISIVKSISDDEEMIKNPEETVKVSKEDEEMQSLSNSETILKNADAVSETKIQLSFSVDRLLNNIESVKSKERVNFDTELEKCYEQQSFTCCSHPSCLLNSSTERILTKPYQISSLIPTEAVSKMHQATTVPSSTLSFSDYASKCIVRPLPIHALGGNNCDSAPRCLPFPTLATTTLFRLHQQQQKPIFPHPHSLPFPQHTTPATNLAPLLVTPLNCNLKSLQLNVHASPTQLQPHQQHFRHSPVSPNHFSKPKLPTSPTVSTGHYHPTLHQLHQHQLQHQHQPILTHLQLGNSSSATTTTHNININSNNNNHNNGNGHNNSSNSNNNSNNNNNNHNSNGKRKRSWSRAVFSNLQRKGLEIQFQQQKYITKPDRRKLAARLNLTDAQVKVWFQNRRMKWRHTRENLKSGQEKQAATVDSQGSTHQQLPSPGDMQHEIGYSSDGSDCSMAIDDNDDDGEIDVVE